MDATVVATQTPAAKNGDGERSRAVDAAILQIEKQFGRGAIMRLGDREAQNVPAVSTGSIVGSSIGSARTVSAAATADFGAARMRASSPPTPRRPRLPCERISMSRSPRSELNSFMAVRMASSTFLPVNSRNVIAFCLVAWRCPVAGSRAAGYCGCRPTRGRGDWGPGHSLAHRSYPFVSDAKPA